MIEVAVLCTALAADPTVWLVPTSDYTTYRVHARNDGLVCCGELYVRFEDTPRWTFDAMSPFDFYGDLDWTIIGSGQGLAIWTFPPGASWAPFNELVGEFYGSGPLFFSPPPWGGQGVFMYDGVIPNLPLLTNSYKTCPGDFTGDGFVNTQDMLYMLSRWGTPYTNNDFLDLIGNWSEVPFGCYDGPENP